MMDEFSETPMADDVSPLPQTPAGRFPDVARASRDRDLYADATRDTVLYREERTDPPTYDWCYLDLWDMGRNRCRMIVMRHGKRRSGKSAYFGP